MILQNQMMILLNKLYERILFKQHRKILYKRMTKKIIQHPSTLTQETQPQVHDVIITQEIEPNKIEESPNKITKTNSKCLSDKSNPCNYCHYWGPKKLIQCEICHMKHLELIKELHVITNKTYCNNYTNKTYSKFNLPKCTI